MGRVRSKDRTPRRCARPDCRREYIPSYYGQATCSAYCGQMYRRGVPESRNIEIRKQLKSGLSLTYVASQFSLSRERIRQIRDNV